MKMNLASGVVAAPAKSASTACQLFFPVEPLEWYALLSI